MEQLGSERIGQRVSMWTVATSSFIGGTMEWYDFFLYGTASALVFNKLFFPQLSPLAGTLASFATFGVGFLTRPIGGIIFGHFGDKVGRKTMLILTLVIIGLATFVIGLLPTYASIGIWAPVLLVVVRLLQGFGLGGEYGGAALLTIEHAPRERRGFWGSLPQISASAGILLSTGVFALFSLLPKALFLSWGWRVPFLISIVLVFIGLFIRLRIMETPAFQRMKETRTEAKLPLVELLRTYPKNILLTLGARLAETVSSNIFNAFATAYVATQLKLSTSVALTGILLGSALSIIVIPFFGALSDRIGRRPVYIAGTVVVALIAFPFFWLLNTKVLGIIWLTIVVAYTFGPTLIYSVESTFFTELFGTRVRYSGLSVAYQISGIIGGLTPLIATSLLVATGGSPWLVAIFLLAISVLSLISVALARETFKRDIAETEEQRVLPQPSPSGGVV